VWGRVGASKKKFHVVAGKPTATLTRKEQRAEENSSRQKCYEPMDGLTGGGGNGGKSV